MSPTRRTLLGTAALTLGGGALAGCLGGSTPSGDATPDETSSRPETDPADERSDSSVPFARWLPDPRNSPFGDGYGVRYFDAAAIRERRSDLHENAYERLHAEMLNAGPSRDLVDESAVTATLGVGFDVSVALGSFDPGAVRERYARERARRETAATATTHAPEETAARTPEATPERYDGFDVFGANGAYAVSENAVIEVRSLFEGDPREYARAVVDARSAETGYADANAYVDAMLGLVDGPHALKCYPEAMDGSTSRGFREDVMTGGLRAWRFGGETTRLTYANTYPDAEAAADADLDVYVDGEALRFGPYDGLDVETEGRLVWTEGTIPTGEFDFLAPGGPNRGVHTPNG